MEDSLLEGNPRIKVRSTVPIAIQPTVLAAFLAHDFPLVDALMWHVPIPCRMAE
jgi:hypothetical protein